jgi:hypothetical protein
LNISWQFLRLGHCGEQLPALALGDADDCGAALRITEPLFQRALEEIQGMRLAASRSGSPKSHQPKQ